MDILVVVASAELCRVMGDVLHVEGHRVWEAQDGQTASRLLRSRLPDAVVVDARLPDCEGIDLLRALRDTPGGDRVLAVVVAEDPAVVARQGTGLAVRAVLRQPLDVLDLSDLIRDASAPPPPSAEVSEIEEDAGDTRTVRASVTPEGVTRLPPFDAWQLLGLVPGASREAIEAATDRLVAGFTEEAQHERSLDARARASSMVARVRAARRELLGAAAPRWMQGAG